MRRLATGLRSVKTQYYFELAFMDKGHVTFPLGRKEYSLVVVDSFTKWAEVRMVSYKTGPPSLDFFERISSRGMDALSVCSLTMGDPTSVRL